MNTGLHGKVAIVTGASKGIGKAIALAFANEGVRLTICARREEQLSHTEQEIKDRYHTEVITVKANITKINDIKRVISRAIAKYKRIDILVNNAGSLFKGGIFQLNDEEFENQIHLRLLGSIRITSLVIPIMQQQGGGRIINIVGTAGKEPTPSMMIHSIICGALLAFTKALAVELAPYKINVNAVNPGVYENIINEQLSVNQPIIQKNISNGIKQNISNLSRSATPIKPEDVAQAVIFLASEAANSISGISINVDGGIVHSSA